MVREYGAVTCPIAAVVYPGGVINADYADGAPDQDPPSALYSAA